LRLWKPQWSTERLTVIGSQWILRTDAFVAGTPTPALTLDLPSFRNIILDNRLVTEVNTFVADLNLARSEAIARNTFRTPDLPLWLRVGEMTRTV
jgi:hypothetical protein